MNWYRPLWSLPGGLFLSPYIRISAPVFTECAPSDLFSVATAVCEVTGLRSPPTAMSSMSPSTSTRGKSRSASGTNALYAEGKLSCVWSKPYTSSLNPEMRSNRL